MGDAAPADTVVPTADGSATLRSGRYGETYHSIHGAARESREVYLAASGVLARIEAGQPTRVLEIGFGLGLNFLLSADRARARGARLDYHACEHDLLTADTLRALGYGPLLTERAVLDALLAAIARAALPAGNVTASAPHALPALQLTLENVSLTLHRRDAGTLAFPRDAFDAVYLDAFSPPVNPECWTRAFLDRLFDSLRPGGVLVSYCVRGSVRRALAAAGFSVARRPGPPGKRQTLVATRPASA